MRCSHCGSEIYSVITGGECPSCGEEFIDIENAEPIEKDALNSYKACILRKKGIISERENKELLDILLWVKNNSASVKIEDLKALVKKYNKDVILQTVNRIGQKVGYKVVPADDLSDSEKKKYIDNLIWIKDQALYLVFISKKN